MSASTSSKNPAPLELDAVEVDTEGLPEIVAEELRHLADTRNRLARRPPEAELDIEAIVREMARLRDDIPQAQTDERPSLLMQYERLGHLLEQAGKSSERGGGIDEERPYFAHMRLEENGKIRDVFLGNATRLDNGLRIVDWRHAPVSALFYRHAEGDEYEEEFGDRLKEGTILARRTLGIHDDSLRRVQAPAGVWYKDAEGQWVDLSQNAPRLEGGGGEVLRFYNGGDEAAGRTIGSRQAYRVDKHLPEISALIDKDQFAIITEGESQLVVIRGVAGSGKTTVALHRLAYLNFQDGRRFRKDRMMVVVWSRAMRQFISRLLANLGVEGVPVRTFGEWAHNILSRHFQFLPDDRSDDTPAIVTRMKLHPAMLKVMETYVRRSKGHKDPRQVIDDWMAIMTDRARLKRGFNKHAPGVFTDDDYDRFVSWTARQVDLLMDWLNPDAGEPDDPEEQDQNIHEETFLDDEDDPLLLRLYQLRVGPLSIRRGRPLRYTHLVIDEVQDLSPLEVRVLMDCTSKERSLTLAGDTQQHVLQEAGFTNWEEFFGHLGVKGTAVNTLKVSYRSTQPIVDFALKVLGPLAEDEEPPRGARDGAPVEVFSFGDHGEALAFLVDGLRDVEANEPKASIALLARSPDVADLYYQGLEKAGLDKLRRVANQDFSFTAGIEVTDVQQAKGLEFDYVVLLDVSAESWPDTSAARRQLHVGATRAAHQLWVTSVGAPSPIVAEAMRAVEAAK